MNLITKIIGRFKTTKPKSYVILTTAVLISILTVGTVWALVPPSAFGYLTLCHDLGTPDQTTLILLPEEAQEHIDHGDPKVRCADAVPASAFDPNVDLSKGYFVDEIDDDLYWVTEGSYQMMFLVHKSGVIVVDAPPTIGQNILNAISDVTDKPITHVVYSHTHADHIGAAGLYPDDAIVIAHEEAANQLEATLNDGGFPFGIFAGVDPANPPPLPDKTFKKQLKLKVGDQELQLDYLGTNHEPGNIFIYAPGQKVLMLVDVIFPGWTPFANLALAEDIPGFFLAHEQTLSYDFDTFIGGHLTRLGTRMDVETQQAYILDVQANAATALQTVNFFEIAGETGFENQWLLFDTYLDTVAQTCADLTIPNWVGVLAAADVNTYSHCWSVMESLRIE